MRKFLCLIVFFATLLTTGRAWAQTEEPSDGKKKNEMMFNHLGLGLEFGTTGIGLEVAMPCTSYLAFRTGFTIMPHFGYKDNVDYTKYPNDPIRRTEESVDVKGKLYMADWKLLADFYPSPASSGFHISAGFYVGKEFPIRAKNTSEINIEEGEGIEVGGIFVRPDDNGIARVNIATRRFKPYLGIGFGRAIPKRRADFTFDLGAQFWGKPCMKTYSPDEDVWVKVNKGDVDDKDMDKALDIIKKVIVYPVLSFHINFRAF